LKLLFLNSTVSDGNMSENMEPGVGKLNSEIFFKRHNVNINDTIYLNIKDLNIIREFEYSIIETKPYNIPNIDADAIITKKNNLFLYQKFGDCIPFTVFDKKQNILVFAHLGIVSVFNNLHIDIINKLRDDYFSKIEDLECYLGPSIKKESYLKKIENNEIIKKYSDFLTKKEDNSFFVDLQGYVVYSLAKLGISNNQISISDIDTAKDERYFSHHRSRNSKNIKNGRFIYGVMMVDE